MRRSQRLLMIMAATALLAAAVAVLWRPHSLTRPTPARRSTLLASASLPTEYLAYAGLTGNDDEKACWQMVRDGQTGQTGQTGRRR